MFASAKLTYILNALQSLSKQINITFSFLGELSL